MHVTLSRGMFLVSLIALGGGAAAQDVDERGLDALDNRSVASVMPLKEAPGAAELRAAMRRISYNAMDADALADAGNAALALGDANAALNFFTKANALRPNNGRIVAGLAAATVRTENPFEALRLFDDAVRLGISDRSIAADRALAFDLLGNFARARQDYALARTAASSDDLLIRHAISTSLDGQKSEADSMLLPLLQKDNVSAWRARAFMLAARGDLSESTKVARGFMDAGSVQRMERYLRLMPELTGAQQAAAIHLGHFPASQNVGRDSDQLRRVASAVPPVMPGPGESRLIPSGNPLGRKDVKTVAVTSVKAAKKSTRRERDAVQENSKAPVPVGTSVALGTASSGATRSGVTQTPAAARSLPQPESAEAVIARLTSDSPGQPPPPKTTQNLATPQVSAFLTPAAAASSVAAAQPALPPTASNAAAQPVIVVPLTQPSTSASLPVPAPTVTANNLASAAASSAVIQGPTLSGAAASVTASPPAPVVAASVSPPPTVSVAPAFDLASIVSAIEIPESEQKPSAVPVDLKKIKPAVPKVAAVDVKAKTPKVDAKAAAKAKAEAANPARYWVQIATGDAGALGYDYRKWTKKSAALFKGQNGWTSAWGKTDRLLVGPFADMKAAKKWEGEFKKAGGDGFMWKSENGVAVTALKSK